METTRVQKSITSTITITISITIATVDTKNPA